MNIKKFLRELDEERVEWADLENRLKTETWAAELQNKKEATTIKLHEQTKERLLQQRAYPTETFEGIIIRLLQNKDK